jgi:glutathione S-transferase
VKATGRQTVPCLRIERADGSVEWMHESEDINAYLKERFGS